MDLPKAIRVRMAKAGKSQNWLAAEIHVTRGNLSQFMTGTRPWRLSVLRSISRVFDMKLSTLIEEAESYE